MANPTPFNQLSPEDQALLWGSGDYMPGYNSNDEGSYERNYNQVLNTFTPEQLIKRYSQPNKGQFSGIGTDRSYYALVSTFRNMFGRDITANELSLLAPAFQGPNGEMNGRAALANLQNQYKSNPTLDPSSALNNRKPADISGNVAGLFKSILGRDASQDELDHFTQAIQTNQIDTYGLANFLKTQPEYTNAQDQQFRSGLNNELQNYDTQEFNREKGDIISAYGKNGMAAGFDANGKSLSPSLDYALTDLMGKIASNRSAYLAQLSASQYGGNKQLATDNYQNTLNQMYSQNQDRTSRMNNLGDTLMNRGFQGADYTQQRNDFMNYANSIPQYKPNFFDYLNTGANVARGVAGIGSLF